MDYPRSKRFPIGSGVLTGIPNTPLLGSPLGFYPVPVKLSQVYRYCGYISFIGFRCCCFYSRIFRKSRTSPSWELILRVPLFHLRLCSLFLLRFLVLLSRIPLLRSPIPLLQFMLHLLWTYVLYGALHAKSTES